MIKLNEKLNKLCKQYGYTYDEIGNFYRIKSLRDTWYMKKGQGRNIMLYHQNNWGNSEMHKHERHKNIENIFKTIWSHDHREVKRNNNLIRVTRDLKFLNLI